MAQRVLETVNQKNGVVVATQVHVAGGIWSRFWGLMGRRSLPEGRGLLITPCSSIHMFFMRFPLDVVFIDREHRVVKVVNGIKPWRAALGGKGAHSALELPAGTASSAGLEPGDALELRSA